MMIEDRLLDQEWFQELTSDQKVMYFYLLRNASRKTGIVELNMRTLNFMANLTNPMTKDDVLTVYGERIRLLPNKDNTAIFPDFISVNWIRGDKPIDVVKNPLFKSIVQELAKYGLTINDVNKMSKRKIQVKENDNGDSASVSDSVCVGRCEQQVNDSSEPEPQEHSDDTERMFDAFWEAYPSNCPRKVDKKKCKAKFALILRDSKDPVKKFNDIMNGLEVWKKCSTWTNDNGKYIKAPLVFLNGANWEDKPLKGNNYGNRNGNANSNYTDETYNHLF